jgi:hypothetical protein
MAPFDVNSFLSRLASNYEIIMHSTDCILCGVPGLSDMSQHVREPDHLERQRQVNEALNEQRSFAFRTSQVESLKPRIARLGSSNWQHELDSLLLTYLLDKKLAFHVACKPIIEKLEKYEHMERICLLEQAVWRTVCQINPEKPPNNALFWEHWLKEGWKEKKKEMYHSKESGIIISSVLLFVGN